MSVKHLYMELGNVMACSANIAHYNIDMFSIIDFYSRLQV